MQLVSLEGILIGVGITLLGVIVGGFIGYHFSRKVAEEQIRRIAGAKLRAAFAPEMAEYTLLGRGGYEVGSSLWHSLLDHSAAVEEYKVFVPRDCRGGYQKAWERYYKPLEEKGSRGGSYEDSKIYIDRIEAILKFTEPF